MCSPLQRIITQGSNSITHALMRPWKPRWRDEVFARSYHSLTYRMFWVKSISCNVLNLRMSGGKAPLVCLKWLLRKQTSHQAVVRCAEQVIQEKTVFKSVVMHVLMSVQNVWVRYFQRAELYRPARVYNPRQTRFTGPPASRRFNPTWARIYAVQL